MESNLILMKWKGMKFDLDVMKANEVEWNGMKLNEFDMDLMKLNKMEQWKIIEMKCNELQ